MTNKKLLKILLSGLIKFQKFKMWIYLDINGLYYQALITLENNISGYPVVDIKFFLNEELRGKNNFISFDKIATTEEEKEILKNFLLNPGCLDEEKFFIE